MLTVTANAWTGQAGAAPLTSPVGDNALSWALGKAGRHVRKDLKPTAPDLANWRDARVGWGLVLPAMPGLTEEELASGSDAPEPIRRLIAERSEQTEGGWRVPVFRYHPEAPPETRLRFLHNHRSGKSLSIAGSGPGVADHLLPSYLLIAAAPDKVPWQLQYILAAQRLVGRLDPAMEGLDHYVTALLADFAGAAAAVRRSVIWAVAHADPNDITHTLRQMITRKLQRRIVEDDDLKDGCRFLDGAVEPATAELLIGTLAEHKPALVVTSSHGRTAPLDDPAALAAGLGLPVDQTFATLSPEALAAAWQPEGAIWFAHACCSAGSVSSSGFKGLFAPGSFLDDLLEGVAKAGDRIAPLPQRLLGQPKPLRAFIGQIEPTFDWTLKDPENGQPLTNTLCDALYPGLYLPRPVGLAFDSWNDLVDGYNRTWQALERQFNEGEDVGEKLLMPRLAARDVESTVILGDPTAMLPSL